MKALYDTLLTALLLTATIFTPTQCWGQADPAWLKSWHEAQKSRPESISSSGRIAPENEPGIPLIIHGRLFDPDGTPAVGVIIHAYHRDRDGYDFGPHDNALTTWRLQGWVKTDAEGRFTFTTIRPAPDHLNREGAHIHFTLDSDEFGRQWAPTVYLADDERVNAEQLRRSEEAGKFGWVREVRAKDGVQHVDVVIKLEEESDF